MSRPAAMHIVVHVDCRRSGCAGAPMKAPLGYDAPGTTLAHAGDSVEGGTVFRCPRCENLVAVTVSAELDTELAQEG